jgi:WhiB family redox-sensing transcriptional regulator
MLMPPRITQMIGDLPRWMSHSACRDVDPELFFGPDFGWGREHSEAPVARAKREASAKALCQTCPVREACLEYAMTAPEHDGVWGGVTAAERERMRLAALHTDPRRMQPVAG